MNKKKLLLIISGAVVLVAAVVLAVVLLSGIGAGTADKPVSLSSAGAFNSWFAPGKGLSKKDAGTYYFRLDRDVTLKKEAIIEANNAVIDLNGHTLTAKDSRVFSVTGGSLTLKNGTVQANGIDQDGGVLYLNGSGIVLELVDVHMANTDDSAIGDRVTGGVIYASSPADGEPAQIHLKGATTVTGSPSGLRRNGGAMTVDGNAQLYVHEGAAIQNGKASVAGNVYMDGLSALHMVGGTIQGGTAVKTDPTSGFAGNVMLQTKARLYMHSGAITDGYADYNGGNVFISNTAKHEEASGLYLYGGNIANGYAFSDGGNIYATEKHSVIHAYGGTVENGSAMRGANVFIQGGEMELWGTSLMGNPNSEDTVEGGNIYATKGTVSIYDGLVANGITSTCGGNIYVTGSTLNIYGGVIRGGSTASESVGTGGGNIYAGGKSVFRLYGGEICDGTANCKNIEESSAAGGNIIVASSSFMEMFGGSVKNGTIHGAITRGGGIYVYGQVAGNDTVMHMYGGTVENGPTDNKMRGMCVAGYSETKDDNGFGTARIFDGELIFTGGNDHPDRKYAIYGNKTSGRDMILFDPTGYEGMYSRTQTGACTDPTHNNKTGSVEATCLTHGYDTYSCATCGDWCLITSQPTGHTEQTQTLENGLTTHSCTGCDHVWYTKNEE